MESKLRVGVVGVGHFGNYHAQIYSKMPGTTLVAVADRDSKRAQSVALACRCMAVTDPLALLDQVDAVSIAVPTVHHLEVARPFLEKGIHVLLEKPIATNSKEAVELISLARRNNAILQIGHLERFNGGVRALLENAQDVQFIEAHRLGIFSNRSTDVDVIMDLMIHDIDIVLALTQSEPIKIDAVGTPVLTRHVDIANARLEFENGAVANITASRVSNKRLRRIRVFSNGSYYGMNYEDQELVIIHKDGASVNTEGQLMTHQKKMSVKSRPSLEVELFDFTHSVRKDQPPVVDGYAGLAALQIALQVKEKIALCVPNQKTSHSLT